MLRELHHSDWRRTKDTLHLYCQVVGRIRLATTAPRKSLADVPRHARRAGNRRRDPRAAVRVPMTTPFPRRSRARGVGS